MNRIGTIKFPINLEKFFQQIEVLLERLENEEGMVVLSNEKAAHKQNWDKIVKVYHDGDLVRCKVKSVVQPPKIPMLQ